MPRADGPAWAQESYHPCFRESKELPSVARNSLPCAATNLSFLESFARLERVYKQTQVEHEQPLERRIGKKTRTKLAKEMSQKG